MREERCTNSELETARLGGKIDGLNVLVTKFEEVRDNLKGLFQILVRERTAICGRRDNLLREGERKRAKFAGLKFIKYRSEGQEGGQGGAQEGAGGRGGEEGGNIE